MGSSQLHNTDKLLYQKKKKHQKNLFDCLYPESSTFIPTNYFMFCLSRSFLFPVELGNPHYSFFFFFFFLLILPIFFPILHWLLIYLGVDKASLKVLFTFSPPNLKLCSVRSDFKIHSVCFCWAGFPPTSDFWLVPSFGKHVKYWIIYPYLGKQLSILTPISSRYLSPVLKLDKVSFQKKPQNLRKIKWC